MRQSSSRYINEEKVVFDVFVTCVGRGDYPPAPHAASCYNFYRNGKKELVCIEAAYLCLKSVLKRVLSHSCVTYTSLGVSFLSSLWAACSYSFLTGLCGSWHATGPVWKGKALAVSFRNNSLKKENAGSVVALWGFEEQLAWAWRRKRGNDATQFLPAGSAGCRRDLRLSCGSCTASWCFSAHQRDFSPPLFLISRKNLDIPVFIPVNSACGFIFIPFPALGWWLKARCALASAVKILKFEFFIKDSHWSVNQLQPDYF